MAQAGILTLDVTPGEGDAELFARWRRALRAPGIGLCIASGDMSARIDDAEAFANWIGLAVGLACPLLVLADGPLGPRGVALVLAADRACVTRRASLAEGWRDMPGLAALALRRAGPGVARALLFSEADLTTDDLARLGLVDMRDDLPLARQAFAAPAMLAVRSRAKRCLRAAQELPFSEALAFDVAFRTGAMETSR
jgi:enoyl-CoA hydratase/carnithine racemase